MRKNLFLSILGNPTLIRKYVLYCFYCICDCYTHLGDQLFYLQEQKSRKKNKEGLREKDKEREREREKEEGRK